MDCRFGTPQQPGGGAAPLWFIQVVSGIYRRAVRAPTPCPDASPPRCLAACSLATLRRVFYSGPAKKLAPGSIMLRVNPFAALRPSPALASEVASVPYDVVNTDEARRLAEGHPLSFLHVVRSEIDLPPDTDPHAGVVYERALQNFRTLEREALVREPEPAIYLYRQAATLLGRQVCQTGVVVCLHVDDYASGIIKRHEKTRRDKEDDRTRHVLTLKTNTGPVFMMYRDRPRVAELVEAETAAAPLYDFVAVDGVRHQVWKSAQPQRYLEELRQVDAAYVADGHHRAASAARAAAELRASNPSHHGDEEYNWFLAALFPASELTILPYHRVVRDLNGLDAEALLARLQKVAVVAATSEPLPSRPHAFGMYLGKQWYSVVLPESLVDVSDPVASLDYSLLHEHVLSPILGIGDIRTDQRIDFVGGIRGTAELERRVDSGRDAVAFAMRATTTEHVLRVADAGQIMPPKSTWFEPKLRSGLLIHTLT
jgi:uncharacterized protein (DUF1015 family)